MDCSLYHPWLSHWQRKLFESISPLNISPLIISPWTISLATFIVWNYFTFYITLYLTGNVILRSDWNYLTLYLTVKVIESVSHSLLLCFFPLSLAVLLFIFNCWYSLLTHSLSIEIVISILPSDTIWWWLVLFWSMIHSVGSIWTPCLNLTRSAVHILVVGVLSNGT